MSEREPIIVRADEDIIDLIPIYLERRRQEVKGAHEALAKGEFETLCVMGHQLKGTGAGYGMERLTEIGEWLEEAAKAMDAEGVRQRLREVEEYLERVQVVPE